MNTVPQPRVFLSYARADRARVAKLAEALTAASINVWWDTAIEGGASFSADIERELEAADVVVVVWSATSIKSDWVRDEAGAGRDRKRLVPVQIDATLPPLGLRQFQAIDLSAWKGRAGDAKFSALVSAIHKLAGAEVAAPVARPAPANSGPSRRALIGGAAGVAVLAAGGFGAWKFMGQPADDGTASVVVLPFANLSGDPEQAFFSDGIAEELRNALSKISGLKVIGRVTSEQFRDTKDLSAAAEKLGVDHVLTGSVRRSPTTIRIGAQLVDGRTGVESWSQSYDQPIGDSLVIQSKIATSVVAALSAKLSKVVGTIVVGGTSNPQAQELFLKGRALVFEGAQGEARVRQRLALYDAAIALDPNYADAWAMKGLEYIVLRRFAASAADWAALQGRAMAASQRAVALAPDSGFAHVSLAHQYLAKLDVRRAVAEADTALALAPNDSDVLVNAGRLLWNVDPDRAVILTRKASNFDPFNGLWLARYAGALIYARQYKEAAEAARQTMALNDSHRGYGLLLAAQLALGKQVAVQLPRDSIQEEWLRLALTAIAEARAGNRAAAAAAQATLRSKDLESRNYGLAMVQAQAGETDAALTALEAALQRKESGLIEIAVNPFLDPIRREPRFKAVQDAVIPPDLFVPPKAR